MDVTNVVQYIDKNGLTVNLIGLKLHKTWCFMLSGVIETKLSTERKHIYNKRQVLVEFPNISNQVVVTTKTMLEKVFSKYGLPKKYKKFRSLEALFDVIKQVDLSEVDGPIQVLYLCLQLLMEYIGDYEGSFSEDEGQLIKGLVYIVYEGLVKMVRLTPHSIEEREVEVVFNVCDLK